MRQKRKDRQTRYPGVHTDPSRLPDQPGDVPLTCADPTRAQEELGFAPTTDLATGLARFTEWYRGAFGA